MPFEEIKHAAVQGEVALLGKHEGARNVNIPLSVGIVQAYSEDIAHISQALAPGNGQLATVSLVTPWGDKRR